ncbi:MAG: hypothetical protein CVU54_17020 [Deltaproteobacteria bacterium HGW-Deltaproteobacteria-12]|nr:MAG: hypothetical protein CVU54_17020 [Deltaproteobacteria bacterium HGW-Deltaproteobacteria-12]
MINSFFLKKRIYVLKKLNLLIILSDFPQKSTVITKEVRHFCRMSDKMLQDVCCCFDLFFCFAGKYVPTFIAVRYVLPLMPIRPVINYCLIITVI